MNHFSIDGPSTKWIVLFHGTGGNEYSLLQIAGDIDEKASILTFLGDVGEGSNRRFFAPLENGRLNRQSFHERVQQFLDKWPSLRPENATSITFLGYSNGANFILGLLEKDPNIADEVILLHPSNLHYTFERGSDMAIHITTGAQDTLATAGEVMKLAQQLQQVFPKTTWKLLDGSHGVTEQEITYLQQLTQSK